MDSIVHGMGKSQTQLSKFQFTSQQLEYVSGIWFGNLQTPKKTLPWCGSEVKASACNAGDLGSIPELGRSPGEGNGNPLQYSCLENPIDGGAWWATVHKDAESDTTQ